MERAVVRLRLLLDMTAMPMKMAMATSAGDERDGGVTSSGEKDPEEDTHHEEHEPEGLNVHLRLLARL